MSTDAITTTVGRLDARLRERSGADIEINFNEIVRLYELGHSPEDIADECDDLTIADVYVALKYYFAYGTEAKTDLNN